MLRLPEFDRDRLCNATVTAPLLSFGASGQIAKSQVYATWKGRPYVRRHVIPSNPNSTEQQLTRSVFAFLTAVWKVSPTLFQDPWTAFAKGKVMTNRNAFNQKNIPVLRTASDLTDMIFSPGAAGGLPYTAMAITPGSGQLSVAVTPPDLPPAWNSQTLNVVCAIREQDPNSGLLYGIFAASEPGGTNTVVLDGLGAHAYVVGAWPVWQKSALATDLAYGPSLIGTGTST